MPASAIRFAQNQTDAQARRPGTLVLHVATSNQAGFSLGTGGIFQRSYDASSHEPSDLAKPGSMSNLELLVMGSSCVCCRRRS